MPDNSDSTCNDVHKLQANEADGGQKWGIS